MKNERQNLFNLMILLFFPIVVTCTTMQTIEYFSRDVETHNNRARVYLEKGMY